MVNRRSVPCFVLILGVLMSLQAPGAGEQAVLTSPGSPEVVSLQSLVREALERNPEIQAARLAADAKRARIRQAGAWPDPKLSVSYGGNVFPPFTIMPGDPSSNRQIMAEQEVPYPGKTRLRSRVAAKEADAESFVADSVARRVTSEIKQTYFELHFTDQSLSTLRQSRELLERFEKVAEIRYSVGKAAQQDVLRAQVELSKINERATMLEQSRRALTAQLNSLRDRAADAPIGSPAELRPSTLPSSIDDLLSAAQSSFPDLKRQRTMVDGNRLAFDLAKRDVRPDFSVGYAYMQRHGLPDMYGITLSTSLPVFRRSKQDMAITEAAANLESSRRMEANELRVLRYRVEQEYFEVQAAEKLLKLYSQAVVPQSRLALDSSVASYETGATDFLTVLTNLSTVLDYQLNYQQQLVNHEKALARLEELTGLNLTQ